MPCKTRTQICACQINTSFFSVFFYRQCLLISGENIKRFWILVRVLVSNKCWRHAEHIVVSSACRQKFVLGWSFSPRWIFVQRVASRVALSEDINTISAQHAPDMLQVSKILVQNLYEFYEFCSTFLRHCYNDWGNLFLYNFYSVLRHGLSDHL